MSEEERWGSPDDLVIHQRWWVEVHVRKMGRDASRIVLVREQEAPFMTLQRRHTPVGGGCGGVEDHSGGHVIVSGLPLILESLECKWSCIPDRGGQIVWKRGKAAFIPLETRSSGSGPSEPGDDCDSNAGALCCEAPVVNKASVCPPPTFLPSDLSSYLLSVLWFWNRRCIVRAQQSSGPHSRVCLCLSRPVGPC